MQAADILSEMTLEPTTKLEVEAAQIRTPESMASDMERGEREAVEVAEREIPFRPMMDASEYEAMKEQAQSLMPSEKPSMTPAVETALAVPTVVANFEGVNQNEAGGLLPPDTHGAVGATQFVEITNTHLDIYQKASPNTRVRSISLAAFFGYFTQTLFDPRVVYDTTWNRWVITAEARPESNTVQRHFIAVSTGPDATGSFYIYSVNVNFFGNDNFWDYPQLGMDQDSIIITANIFPAFTADMFAVAKARLYNGLGFSVPVFTNLVPTLAPPIVLDQNPKTFLIAAPPNGSALKLYTLTNSSRAFGATLTGPVDVSVPAYRVPRRARQPGTDAELDTLDNRFVNASTQIGNSLWQVHTIDLAGFPAPRFYELNTATNSVIQSGFFFASPTSDDFNASIAANSANDVFVTYSSTDRPAGTNAQVRFSGRLHTDPAGIGAGAALFTSPTFYTGGGARGRWGDYSAVTVDPSNPAQAWLVNEKINANTVWGSRIGSVRF